MKRKCIHYFLQVSPKDFLFVCGLIVSHTGGETPPRLLEAAVPLEKICKSDWTNNFYW